MALVILLLGILFPCCGHVVRAYSFGHLINVWALFHSCISHICPFLRLNNYFTTSKRASIGCEPLLMLQFVIF